MTYVQCTYLEGKNTSKVCNILLSKFRKGSLPDRMIIFPNPDKKNVAEPDRIETEIGTVV